MYASLPIPPPAFHSVLAFPGPSPFTNMRHSPTCMRRSLSRARTRFVRTRGPPPPARYLTLLTVAAGAYLPPPPPPAQFHLPPHSIPYFRAGAGFRVPPPAALRAHPRWCLTRADHDMGLQCGQADGQILLWRHCTQRRAFGRFATSRQKNII